MKRYATVAGCIALVVLASFLIVEALGIPILTDPSDRLNEGGIGAAILGAGLLLIDVFVPIPSSVIMIAHGALFGILWGTLLSWTASVGGAMIGWWIGHRGSRLMDRFVSPEEKETANAFLQRWGVLAIVLSRFIPIIAETVAVMSGTTPLGWKRVLIAASIGTLPAALIYSIAGTVTTDLASGFLVMIGVVILATATWFIGKRLVEPVHAP